MRARPLLRFGLSIALLAAAHALGCSPQAKNEQAPKGEAPGRGVIGISVLTMNDPFFKEIVAGLTDEVAKKGYEVMAVSGDNDVAKQQGQVKDFLVKKVAAIVLCPCDSKAIGPVIQEANAAGVPVFTADIACLAPQAKVVSHIATDNVEGGRMAAQALIEALGGAGGKVIVIDHHEVESCILRVRGFKDVLEKHNREHMQQKVEIVAEMMVEGKKDKAFKATQDALQAHPDLAGIFAINDLTALGARAAVEKANKGDQVKIVGFDGQPEGKQAIREGKIYADPIQFPERIGRLTGESILKYFQGEQVPPQILIPTRLYRKADAEKELKG
jgi:ribose transport system substrate-binding protein